jgi:hypothetical protein
MKSDIDLQQVADVADAVYRRTDEGSTLVARAITREVRLYGPTEAVPFDVVAVIRRGGVGFPPGVSVLALNILTGMNGVEHNIRPEDLSE